MCEDPKLNWPLYCLWTVLRIRTATGLCVCKDSKEDLLDCTTDSWLPSHSSVKDSTGLGAELWRSRVIRHMGLLFSRPFGRFIFLWSVELRLAVAAVFRQTLQQRSQWLHALGPLTEFGQPWSSQVGKRYWVLERRGHHEVCLARDFAKKPWRLLACRTIGGMACSHMYGYQVAGVAP